MTGSPNAQLSPSPEGGEYLRQLREHAELTQRELAERAGVRTHSHIGSVERGVKGPSFNWLKSVAGALGIALSEQQKLYRLFGYDAVPERPRPATISREEAAYALSMRPKKEWGGIMEMALRIQAGNADDEPSDEEGHADP